MNNPPHVIVGWMSLDGQTTSVGFVVMNDSERIGLVMDSDNHGPGLPDRIILKKDILYILEAVGSELYDVDVPTQGS